MKGGEVLELPFRSAITELHPGWFVILAMLLALVPVVLGLFTAYLKVSVVLGMVRSALGTQHTPSGVVVLALSLAITAYAMAPVLEECAGRFPKESVQALSLEQIIAHGAHVTAPLIDFVRAHAGDREVHLLTELRTRAPAHPPGEGGMPHHPPVVDHAPTVKDVPLSVLLPAFVLTELKEAFAMGFVLLLPFLVIDLIVANLLVGMGMAMVSPIMVSLPLKILLLVVTDGWLLITRGLIQSYG
jgi:flagellar biosynthesis protein FliP